MKNQSKKFTPEPNSAKIIAPRVGAKKAPALGPKKNPAGQEKGEKYGQKFSGIFSPLGGQGVV
jgi:hypothetical protein